MWEYEIAVFKRIGEEDSEAEQENVMNLLGDEGWELVTVAVQSPSMAYAYFKRMRRTPTGP